MIWNVVVNLPHHMFGGKMNFLDDPKMGEPFILVPKATFKIVEISKKKKWMKISFKEIYNSVDTIGILTGEMEFEIIDFRNMTRYL